jgi:uncharacterized protein with von Willebrand factor type A (vWA) domain
MTDTTDPAIIVSPSGGEIDGRRLLAEAVGFGRALRSAGLSIDLAAAVDYARALTLVELSQRDTVRAAGSAVFVRRRDDREVYDRVFDRWWRQRGRQMPNDGPSMDGPRDEVPGEEADGPGSEAGDDGRDPPDGGTVDGNPMPLSGGDESVDEADIDGHIAAPDAYSAAEALRRREFDRMTAAELRDAERLVDLLEPRLELRRTRRQELHRHGRILAPRAMFRRNIATGGQFTEWVWRRPVWRCGYGSGRRHERDNGSAGRGQLAGGRMQRRQPVGMVGLHRPSGRQPAYRRGVRHSHGAARPMAGGYGCLEGDDAGDQRAYGGAPQGRRAGAGA